MIRKKKVVHKSNSVFMKPLLPSVALAVVTGEDKIPRTEAIKKLWGYIRRNGLQNKKDRKLVNADENLLEIFGGKKSVSMFDIPAIINKNLS
jgi:upstream activation factor subunit UAF30